MKKILLVALLSVFLFTSVPAYAATQAELNQQLISLLQQMIALILQKIQVLQAQLAEIQARELTASSIVPLSPTPMPTPMPTPLPTPAPMPTPVPIPFQSIVPEEKTVNIGNTPVGPIILSPGEKPRTGSVVVSRIECGQGEPRFFKSWKEARDGVMQGDVKITANIHECKEASITVPKSQMMTLWGLKNCWATNIEKAYPIEFREYCVE